LFGVNLPNESIIVNEKVSREKPKLVQGFLNASLRGWVYAAQNPDEAVDILVKTAPNLDRTEQKEQLEQIVPLLVYGDAKTKGVGYVDMKALEYTHKFLLEHGVIKTPVDIKASVDTSFWEKVPDSNKVVKR
jgi:NitT/TauT family transport system substrate-binding protein